MTQAHLHPTAVRMTLPRRAGVTLLYVRALLTEFRITLVILSVLIAFAALLHYLTPAASLDGNRCGIGDSIYAAWMALLAQPHYTKCPWYLKVIYGLYPVMGLILIGEGVVRLALLMMSKRQGEKEWMRVVASTYRDHVILCGLGHLGFRVLEELVAGTCAAVVLERSAANPFLSQAKAMKVPVLVRDMQDDQALIDAGVEHAASIIICSNDEMANLEVAIDARRMNPSIRLVMRLFQQQLASKISGALTIDAAFSSSALAAPVVAAMAFKTRVLSTLTIGGHPHVAAEVIVEESSKLCGRRIAEVETGYASRILARTPAGGSLQSPPSPGETLCAGDTLIVHVAAHQLSTVSSAGRR